MSWSVYGKVLESADLVNPNYAQGAAFAVDSVMDLMQTWVIAVNDPTFTNLRLEIWSDRSGAPGKLLHTSTNVVTKADVMKDINGIARANSIKAINFEFADIVMKGLQNYFFVLQGTGYTFNTSSLLLWYKAYPKPPYTPNFSMTYNTKSRAPIFLVPRSARL